MHDSQHVGHGVIETRQAVQRQAEEHSGSQIGRAAAQGHGGSTSHAAAIASRKDGRSLTTSPYHGPACPGQWNLNPS